MVKKEKEFDPEVGGGVVKALTCNALCMHINLVLPGYSK